MSFSWIQNLSGSLDLFTVNDEDLDRRLDDLFGLNNKGVRTKDFRQSRSSSSNDDLVNVMLTVFNGFDECKESCSFEVQIKDDSSEKSYGKAKLQIWKNGLI